MDEFDGVSHEGALKRQPLESDFPEWADCVLTERQFCARYGAVLDGPSPQEEEEY